MTTDKALLDEHNIAVSEGFITVHNANPNTGEYFASNEEYLAAGVGIPASSYIDAPLEQKSGFAICRTADNSAWEYVPDYRGETRYSVITGVSFIVSTMGDYPDDSTSIAPTTQFDKWDGSKWVTDIDAQHLADVNIATAKKAELIAEATVVIAPLADAKAGEYIDDADIPRLTEWQRYRYALTKVDVAKPEWPELPN